MKKVILLLIFSFTTCIGVYAEEVKLSDKLEKMSSNYITNVTKQINDLKQTVADDFATDFINYCTLIICLGAIFFVGMKILHALQKGNPIDFNTLIIPFLFIFLIGSYRPLTQAMDFITQGFEYFVSSKTKNINVTLEELRDQKIELSKKINSKIYEKQIAEASGWFSAYWVGMKKMFRELMEYVNLDRLIAYFFMFLVFISSFLVRIFSEILIILLYLIGPFALAVSIFPIWKDSWKTWLSTYIYVQLFSPLSQLISYILACLEKNSLQADIARLQDIYTHYADKLGTPIQETFYSGLTYIGFMAAGIVMYCAVPTIAGWIVPGQGGSTLSLLTALVSKPGAMLLTQLGKRGRNAVIGTGMVLKNTGIKAAKWLTRNIKSSNNTPPDPGV